MSSIIRVLPKPRLHKDYYYKWLTLGVSRAFIRSQIRVELSMNLRLGTKVKTQMPISKSQIKHTATTILRKSGLALMHSLQYLIR